MTAHLLKSIANPKYFRFVYHIALQLSHLCPTICAAASSLSHLHGNSGVLCPTHQHVCLKLALAVAINLLMLWPCTKQDCGVQICVMDSRAYAALTPGMETAEELDACTLLVNSQVCDCLLKHSLFVIATA